jgi:uncharacterized membrane protein YeiH
MGVITGAFGGVLRDILINEVPLVFRKDIYATACLAGGLVYWLMYASTTAAYVAPLSCAATIILLRYLTLRYNLSLPILSQRPSSKGNSKKSAGHGK